MLEQRIQQQFFEGADLQYQAAEVLARPIADATAALLAAITGGGKLLVAAVVQVRRWRRPGAFVRRRFERESRRRWLRWLWSPAAKPCSRCARWACRVMCCVHRRRRRPQHRVISAAQAKDMTIVVLAGRGAQAFSELLAETDVLVAVPHERAAARGRTAIAGAACLCDAVDFQLMGEQARDDDETKTARRCAARQVGAARCGTGGLCAAADRRRSGRRGLVATDRRTTGTQIEDESIEFKAAARVRELATLGHVIVTSYNRTVLITGEVPAENEKAAVEAAVARVENVRAVVNELGIGGNSSLGSRSTDTIIGGKVKATMVDAKDVQANAFKVVSERGIVYLMGRVSEREAARGAEIASSVSGVQKVVRVFEILSERELADLGRAASTQPAASAPR